MSNDIKALIDYRLSKADEAFEMAQSAIEKKYWNSVASSLYYTCFYLITALFAKHNIQTHTHTGVRAVFGSKFIKEGNVDPKWGKFLTVLFNKRQVGDYGDFAYLTEEEILPLLTEVEEFRVMIMKFL